MLEELITPVVTLMGKYLLDRGKALAEEASDTAKEIAGRLVERALGALKADPAEAKNAERFEQDPARFEASIKEALAERAKADQALASDLRELLAEFRRAAGDQAPRILNTGSGAVATDGGVAAGKGGVAVGGDLHGGVRTRE